MSLNQNQIEEVIEWLNTWDQLKNTVIPIRFKEDFKSKFKKDLIRIKLPLDEDLNNFKVDGIKTPLDEFYYYHRPAHDLDEQFDFRESLKKAINYIIGEK